MALVVGAGAGLGAALFREMVFGATWLVTGHDQFGQQGHAASAHLPGLGIWFVLVVPVLGGLIYGPLIYRFAREARGHGVPEVMLAVAENGGRIRPPVTIVKAVASAITIGVGGSVGREGPIVQIGSALASTLGQLVRMSESRLRIIVACGAAGGIAATFNAPLTGLFFGFEIVLREFSLDALVATSLAAVTGDVISRAIFGSAPFFSMIPHGLSVTNDATYLLVAVLAVAAGLIGIGFKTFLYWLEDFVDELWKGRPEWARPAVGGIALGALLLAVPQMYGVGYPVMNNVISGHVVVGLVLLFLVSKILATSLTLSIGGSGGVFAPSLFIGAMAGMAFGTLRPQRVRTRGRPAGAVRRRGDGRGVRGCRSGAADRHRQRRGDDRQLRPHPSDHAHLRDRRRGLQAPLLRQHVHHQAAAPRDRHRTPQDHQRAADADRRRRDGTASTIRRRRPAAATPQTRVRQRRSVTGPKVANPRRNGDRHSPAAGAVWRGDPRAGTAPAHPLRPGRPAGALDRPRAPAGLDHPTRHPRRADPRPCSPPSSRSSRVPSPRTSAPTIPRSAAHRSSTPLTGYEIVEITHRPRLARGRAAQSTRSPGLRTASAMAVIDEHAPVVLREDTTLSAGQRVIVIAPSTSSDADAREPLLGARG